MDQRFLEIPDAADVSAFLWINIRNLIAMRTQDLEGRMQSFAVNEDGG